MRYFKVLFLVTLSVSISLAAPARDYHVATTGDDSNSGTSDAPLRTISAAAAVAQPGDVVTVHAGLYRERITPPRGGTAESTRIVYQAAPGEQVEIRGSEIVTGWDHVSHDTWKAVLPNTLFGDYNPFADPIAGDWFNPKGRPHHTGAVYCDGHQLIEAAQREEVLQPPGAPPAWLIEAGDVNLLNVAWFEPHGNDRIDATAFTENDGTRTAPNEEGGECIGWIEHGDWVEYENVAFGQKTTQLSVRAASQSQGGLIEIRLNTPEGKLIGQVDVPNTGGWQAWETFTTKIIPVGGEHTVYLVFKGRPAEPLHTGLSFAEVGEDTTTVWAQFQEIDPNEHEVEVNVRRAVFYPDKPGVNYITVRGFTMRHAATQWAPPTAEQIGLIGTHWSKGWIIEENTISHSRCTGITLGKYGDEFDNTSADTAEGYVMTIERALENGWSRENIGHHIVRNNHISHCEQAGIVGSLGAIFSTITGNTLHDIHVRRFFTGAEMAGIKLHAAIDTEISHNHLYRTVRGIWLDWMAQGARVTGNLLHDNIDQDLFMEVNHGPFLIDNNIFLSDTTLLDVSQGGAYAHNLIAGRIVQHPELNRETPYHPAHVTEVAGLSKIQGGDNRFINNIFSGEAGLRPYDRSGRPIIAEGNVYWGNTRPHRHENDAAVLRKQKVTPELNIQDRQVWLTLPVAPDAGSEGQRALVTSDRLGRAQVPDLPYANPDGLPVRVDTDYLGRNRNIENPTPGPFTRSEGLESPMRVWPK